MSRAELQQLINKRELAWLINQQRRDDRTNVSHRQAVDPIRNFPPVDGTFTMRSTLIVYKEYDGKYLTSNNYWSV